MAIFSERNWQDWIEEYEKAHKNPINRLCHTIGIPMIALSIFASPLLLFFPSLWGLDLALFIIGWILQFIGHVFEKKPPEFFKDWRFLFVGLRWWWIKIRQKA